MGVYESHAKIKKTCDDMNILWGQTRAQWKDARAGEFEKNFIERINIESKRALSALENISLTLNRIRSEFKDEM